MLPKENLRFFPMMTYHFYSSQLILLQVLYVLILKIWLFLLFKIFINVYYIMSLMKLC